jgi:hypothetical protein
VQLGGPVRGGGGVVHAAGHLHHGVVREALTHYKVK